LFEKKEGENIISSSFLGDRTIAKRERGWKNDACDFDLDKKKKKGLIRRRFHALKLNFGKKKKSGEEKKRKMSFLKGGERGGEGERAHPST